MEPVKRRKLNNSDLKEGDGFDVPNSHLDGRKTEFAEVAPEPTAHNNSPDEDKPEDTTDTPTGKDATSSKDSRQNTPPIGFNHQSEGSNPPPPAQIPPAGMMGQPYAPGGGYPGPGFMPPGPNQYGGGGYPMQMQMPMQQYWGGFPPPPPSGYGMPPGPYSMGPGMGMGMPMGQYPMGGGGPPPVMMGGGSGGYSVPPQGPGGGGGGGGDDQDNFQPSDSTDYNNDASSSRMGSHPQMFSHHRGGEKLAQTGQQPIPLYMSCDDDSLSPYQCLVRRQIEIFEASTEDVESNAQGRNKPISLGQVGIRCRHCTNMPPRQRARASVYYPAKLTGLYQAAQNMATIHLVETCRNLPDQVREELKALKERKSSAGGGKKYWGDGARVLGVIEVEDCLRFQRR